MYDNIFVKFKDSKYSITLLNAWFWCIFFETKRRIVPLSAFDYAMLAQAYSNYDFPICQRLARYYAIKSLRLKRDYAYPYVILSISTYDYEKSIIYSEKAIELAGEDYYLAYLMLLAMCVSLGKWDVFFKYAHKFFQIISDEPHYWIYCIYVNSVLKEKSTAKLLKSCLKSCIKYKYFPSSNHIILLLVEYIFRKGFSDEAIYLSAFDSGFYNIALQIANKRLLKKKEADWFLKKASCLFYLSRCQKSLEAIDKAEQLKSDCPQTDYNFWRAMNYTKQGEYNKALQYINKSIVLSPTDYKYTSKAFTLNKLEEYEESIKMFEKVIAQEGISDLTALDLYYLAQDYYYTQDYSHALSTINKCLLKEQDADNCYLKSVILENMDKIDEAQIWYQKYQEFLEDK